MSEQSHIPLEDALKNGLETSTREELVEYCALMGIDNIDHTGTLDHLKNALFAAAGYPVRGASERTPAREIPRSSVIPPMNLTPHGRWGGRRRIIELNRPEGSKLARAESFGWNGKATYWCPYGEPVKVPWPIYMILLETKRPRPKQIKTTNADGATEITTGWDHESIPFRDLGDDPLTKQLPGSLTEWYQEKGQPFYLQLGQRDLRTVAGRLDIAVQEADRKNRPHDDILSDVLVFLFGYAQSDSSISEQLEA